MDEYILWHRQWWLCTYYIIRHAELAVYILCRIGRVHIMAQTVVVVYILYYQTCRIGRVHIMAQTVVIVYILSDMQNWPCT